jgi:protein SCO1/2
MSFWKSAALACVIALTACGASPAGQGGDADDALRFCVTSNTHRIGGPINLIDDGGKAVTEARFLGKPSLIYFGFTTCAAECPLALQLAKPALAPFGQRVQPIFVSFDPNRDTPERLAPYVRSEAFPKGLVGLTGTQAQIEAAKTAFRVQAIRNEDSASTLGYTFAHTSMFYLMDESWRTIAFMPADPAKMGPEAVSACIAKALDH